MLAHETHISPADISTWLIFVEKLKRTSCSWFTPTSPSSALVLEDLDPTLYQRRPSRQLYYRWGAPEKSVQLQAKLGVPVYCLLE